MRVKIKCLLPIAHAAIDCILVVFFCGCRTNVSTPIAVEFWYTGDDGLSQKLTVAVETAFRQSADFRLTSIDTGGRRLVVWSMRNVESEPVGERIKATCSVRFASLEDNASRNPSLQRRLELSREISTRRVSCWESELSNCAAQIVNDAKIAARKMPN
jgi:hypothetical protein